MFQNSSCVVTSIRSFSQLWLTEVSRPTLHMKDTSTRVLLQTATPIDLLEDFHDCDDTSTLHEDIPQRFSQRGTSEDLVIELPLERRRDTSGKDDSSLLLLTPHLIISRAVLKGLGHDSDRS